MSDNSLDEFKSSFQRLLELRETRDQTKSAFKKAEAAYREKEAELFEELNDAGIRGRLEFDFGGDLGVAKFQRRSTPYGRILDKEAAIAALKEKGLDEVILQEGIREGRLNEMARDWLETGAEFPEGVGYYHRKGISISRK